jgi:hypothetical protein
LLGTKFLSSAAKPPEVREVGMMEVGSGRREGSCKERCAEAKIVHDITGVQ